MYIERRSFFVSCDRFLYWYLISFDSLGLRLLEKGFFLCIFGGLRGEVSWGDSFFGGGFFVVFCFV